MANTANFFIDDFTSYLEANDPSPEQSGSTQHLYPDPEDSTGINPSSLSYGGYPSLSHSGQSYPLTPSDNSIHSADSAANHSTIYDYALDAVLQANSNAQFIASKSSSTSLPHASDSVRSFAPESTATPKVEVDSPQHMARRRSVNIAKSRRKSSTHSAPPKRSRRKSKPTAAIIDMDESGDDEGGHSGEGVAKSKRERALERNRVAASKCREKKKAYHQDLEEQVRRLGDERKGLINNVRALQDQLFAIKGHFLEHVDCQCTGIRDYIKTTVRPLTAEGMAMYQAFDEYIVNQMNGTVTPAMGVAQLQSSVGNLGRDGLPSDVVAAIGSIGFRPHQQRLHNGISG